jgi:hypothetical protein
MNEIKMTFVELLEILKKTYDSVSDFAYGEGPYIDKFSERALTAQKIKDQWVKDNPRPEYSSKDYETWVNNYLSLPDKFAIASLEWKEANGLPDFEEVERTGGESQGSNWNSVKYFPSLDNSINRLK